MDHLLSLDLKLVSNYLVTSLKTNLVVLFMFNQIPLIGGDEDRFQF